MLTSLDATVTVVQGSVSHATWPAGTARNNKGFVIDVAPAAAAHVATLLVTVTTATGGMWEFTVTFDVGPPRVVIEHRRSWLFDPTPGGNRDGVASPGESVLPRIRLWQSGPSTAYNVHVTLEIDDPDVSVGGKPTSYASWNPGSARTLKSFRVDIAGGAVPHDVAAVILVSADDGGSWEFPFVFPIAYRPTEFVLRNAWVFDPTPGGDKDGELEAGERALPRFRLRHVGHADATAVTVRLTTSDPDVTVVVGEVTHDTWPAGVARNNVGFVVDISPFAAPHDVTYTVTTDAGGGIQQFRHTFPIAGPLAKIVVAEAWLTDTKGDRDGIIEPGERVTPHIRLVNIGSGAVTGLRATLVAPDDDFTLINGAVDHGDIASGKGVWIRTLTARIASRAVPRDTGIVVLVTADNAEPVRLEMPIALGRDIGMQTKSVEYDDVDGGNGDGVANPGESGRLDIRLYHGKRRKLSNVRFTVTSDDPQVVVTGEISSVAIWKPWITNTISVDISIASDVSPGGVGGLLTVTADDSDSYEYAWTLSVTAARPELEFRTAWIRERDPDGNGDGIANPGERVMPRVRLKNIGLGAGANVQASLVIVDADVTVTSGFVSHDVWPVGEARNLTGFVLDIAPDATAHDVQAVLSVVANDGGPWTFSFTFPIVASEAVGATSLLANFPNPFNPETWIPFDLSEDAEATIRIYDAAGRQVRRLDLGWLPAGSYRRRTTAAFWDGRNDIGERVSSGLYLYELHAGSHREMRRMIVRK